MGHCVVVDMKTADKENKAVANKGFYAYPKQTEKYYVKCEYCNSWIDKERVNCPNCGAPVEKG